MNIFKKRWEISKRSRFFHKKNVEIIKESQFWQKLLKIKFVSRENNDYDKALNELEKLENIIKSL